MQVAIPKQITVGMGKTSLKTSISSKIPNNFVKILEKKKGSPPTWQAFTRHNFVSMTV